MQIEKKKLNTNDIIVIEIEDNNVGPEMIWRVVQTHFFQIVCMNPNRSLLPKTSTKEISQIQRKKKLWTLIEEYSKPRLSSQTNIILHIILDCINLFLFRIGTNQDDGIIQFLFHSIQMKKKA